MPSLESNNLPVNPRRPSKWDSRSTLAAVVVVGVLSLAGCGSTDTAEPAGETGSESSLDNPEVEVVIDRLEAYWSEADEMLGFDYEPVPPDRISTGEDGVLCNGEEIAFEDLEDNAFVDSGCEEGILVAYDPDYLDDGLARLEATLSHEWGHVIQAQAVEVDLGLDFDGLPIDSELQADCFSGAWVAEYADAALVDLRRDLAEVGDSSDVAVDDDDAHGSSDQRTMAFDLGYSGGPLACVDDLEELLPG